MDQTKDSSTLVLGVIGALLLVVGGGWLYLSFGTAPLAPPPPPTPVFVELPEANIDPKFDLEQNLDMGSMALAAGQLVEPSDGSALYFFLSALAQDPENDEAQAGLRGISDQIAVQARAQLAAGNYPALDQSMRIMRRISLTDPNLLAIGDELSVVVDEKVLAIEGSIARAQWEPAQALLDELNTMPGVDRLLTLELAEDLRETRALAAQAAAAAATEQQAAAAQAQEAAAAQTDEAGDEATADAAADAAADDAESSPADEDAPAADFRAALLAQLRSSIARQRLLQPADTSAAAYLAELIRVAPDDPGVTQGRAELVSALVARGLARGQSGNFDAAGTAFEAAERYAPDSVALTAARSLVRDQQLAAESARVIPVGEMVQIDGAQPRYPMRALRNEVEGFVLLRFTVLEDGTTSDIELVQASDRYSAQFERAARAAVEAWEFVPREFEGQVIAQRVEARMLFELGP